MIHNVLVCCFGAVLAAPAFYGMHGSSWIRQIFSSLRRPLTPRGFRDFVLREADAHRVD